MLSSTFDILTMEKFFLCLPVKLRPLETFCPFWASDLKRYDRMSSSRDEALRLTKNGDPTYS